MIFYDLPDNVLAFTAGKGVEGTAYGVDARETGIHTDCFHLPSSQIMIPRQTHSTNVAWVDLPGEVPDTDAVITSVKGLCVAVKTADCIPVLLYDEAQHIVAAVHAGWRGTVGRIVEKTIQEMGSRGEDIHAIIGPGISLEAFEVGDEVYMSFFHAGFPMERIAKQFPIRTGNDIHLPSSTMTSTNATKWHIDLWEANKWLLEQHSVHRIHIAGACTYSQLDRFYSARQETIRTGRNINGIMLR